MTGSEPAAIEARGIRKTYSGDRLALDGFGLRVKPGTVCALLGSNGAGKTTAVRILTTLLCADTGTATVAGHDVGTDGDAVRRAVGLVGQHAAVDAVLSGRQNLTLFARLNGFGRAAARARAGELLDRFGLQEAADRPVSGYSGGMRRRLDLAVGLIAAAQVLFVDEPTTGLDPQARHDMWRAVRELVSDGATVLLTTQYLEEAEALADHVAMLKDGRIVVEGAPAELTSMVGDSRLELTFASADEAARAARIAEPFAAGSAHPSGANGSDRFVVVPVAQRSSLTRLCAALADAGIEPVDIGVRSPSLDDVFLEVNK